MKKRRIVLLCLLLLCLSLFGCGEKNPEENNPAENPTPTLAQENGLAYSTETNIIDDNYRNYYEIFVYTFCDSDGDGYGDLNGITSKLDYVQEMGFNGIWLMPIHPSPTYHKYDVSDYYAIDEMYGTIEDFQNLLTEAHNRGINIIIDLVVNHTSSEHPWFQEAKASVDSPYREYYNFISEYKDGYNKTGDYYYESRFTAGMPDLNLDSEKVKQEITDIMKYWLDMGVDGFRLDAVTSYYTGNHAKNIEFLSWLNTEAKAIKEDCYIIGECWEPQETILDYYASGIDSFFCFPTAQKSGYIAQVVIGANIKNPGDSYANTSYLLSSKMGEGQILAPFLDNHDTSRIASGLYKIEDDIKLAAGLLSMMNGSTFVYYGDELGFTGDGNDPNKRIAMKWNAKTTATRNPPGVTEYEYVFGSVEEQQENEASILNYYKHAMFLRNQNPEIARGTVEILEEEDNQVAMLRKTWNGESIIILCNISPSDKTYTLNKSELGYETIVGELLVWGEISYEPGTDSDTITVPGYSIIILR